MNIEDRHLKILNKAVVHFIKTHKMSDEEKLLFKDLLEDTKDTGLMRKDLILSFPATYPQLENLKDSDLDGFDDFKKEQSERVRKALENMLGSMPDICEEQSYETDELLYFESPISEDEKALSPEQRKSERLRRGLITISDLRTVPLVSFERLEKLQEGLPSKSFWKTLFNLK